MTALGMIAVGAVIVALALALGAGLGFFASWVLSGFGLTVAWYYCWGAIVLLGLIFKPATVKVKA